MIRHRSHAIRRPLGALHPAAQASGGDYDAGVVVSPHNHVPARVENWDLEAKPFATYKLASGDTFAGLAVTYLGDGMRAQEIYNTGNNRSRMPSMNPPAEWWQAQTSPIVLDMPDEARDAMIAWMAKGQPPGQKPGAIPKAERASLVNRSRNIAIGVGVLAVLAAAYYLTR